MAASILGLCGLSFIGGAAVMHYKGPGAGAISDAFTGAESWFESRHPDPPELPEGRAGVALRRDEAALTADGYTLWHTTEGPEAVLYDMKLNPAHRWKLPTGLEWTAGGRRVRPSHLERCRLYPNGDLLVLVATAGTPYGVALARLDRDSNLVWRREGPFHHDLDVAEDGRIFALTRKQKDTPPAGFEALSRPYADDILTILSPQGEVEREVSVLEAFKGTPYLQTLLSAELTAARGKTAPAGVTHVQELIRLMPDLMPMPPGGQQKMLERLAAAGLGNDAASRRAARMDVLHVNGVRVIGPAAARGSSLLKPGQVLLTLRTPNILAALDPEKGAITWAARGIWRHQHDAQPLPGGHILLFDNLGSARGARVLEYDPVTQAVPWAFPASEEETMVSPFRGRCQRLANGNTLAVESLKRAVEVTPEGKVVWEAGFDLKQAEADRSITGATRYRPEDVPFLKGAGPRPR
jgi:hypothetical protein